MKGEQRSTPTGIEVGIEVRQLRRDLGPLQLGNRGVRCPSLVGLGQQRVQSRDAVGRLPFAEIEEVTPKRG
jgi:hypothetical protein